MWPRMPLLRRQPFSNRLAMVVCAALAGGTIAADKATIAFEVSPCTGGKLIV